jgi:Protein of unknown function (DUF2948)
MMDARFEDGDDAPLALRALAPDDVAVLSALLQDAVFPATEMHYDRKRRRFALLLNRFRWEDRVAAERTGRGYERVQSLLVVQDVLTVQTQGLDRGDKDIVLSLLRVAFVPDADGAGRLELLLAGDGAIALAVEAVDIALRDVTRPYLAPSKKMPDHGV